LATPNEALRRQLQQESCDAILVQEYEDPRFDKVVKIGAGMGLPVFAVFQGGQPPRIPCERILRSRSMRQCSGLIIGSATETQRVRNRYHVPQAKLARILNPLDTELWQSDDRAATRTALGLSASQTVVVWHGRVDIHLKGLDVLIHSWRHVVKTAAASRPHLLLVGDGIDRGALLTLLKKLPQGTWTWIDQYVSDRVTLRRYLSVGDLAVLASRREGFPVASLEAMSCGLPLVATSVAGVDEIISDGRRVGGVVVPTDDVQALADALVKLTGDPGFRNDLAQNARPLVTDRVSYPIIGKQLAEFLGLTSD
jgi:starch synthase